MLSLRKDLENVNDPIVEKDILDLADKIAKYHNLEIEEEKFRSLRLARGVYGQRQPGVQMIRIKIPYGKMTTRQLVRIADISDEYSNGRLHATTRQDIQIHYVSLDKSPELWAKLEQEKITLREACGNTVRNVTASPKAGIDPGEPFDVSPYAHALFEYLLRNPICQEMGRKFKIAFSSNENDTGFSYIHDLGFIPKVKVENGKEIRGFKVLVAGGLGAQPILAQTAHEFLPEDQIVPFTESILRVFDRYGERTRRHKARIKFLVADIGLEKLLELANDEAKAINVKSYKVDTSNWTEALPQPSGKKYGEITVSDKDKYEKWLATNVFEQKQKGLYGIFIKTLLGNISSDTARKLASIVDEYAASDIRVTVNQGYLLRSVRKEALPAVFELLNQIGLAEPGFDSTADVTACPGTDTCNLGISSSTGIAEELERVIQQEFPDLIYNQDIKIKISGCPNSCGQHGLASIGFHGSSLKNGENVLPALQVLLGGGTDGNGNGRIAEKVIKVPSKKGPDVLRYILSDFEQNGNDGEYFKDYFLRQGKIYFYELLKPLADLSNLDNTDYIDWGHEENFYIKTAVGECAGVIIDLVQTLIYDANEKLTWAQESFEAGKYADSIYHSYNVLIASAKALLLSENVKNNSHMSIINNFDKTYVDSGKIAFNEGSFNNHVLRINENEPGKNFAELYLNDAGAFLGQVKNLRKEQLV